MTIAPIVPIRMGRADRTYHTITKLAGLDSLNRQLVIIFGTIHFFRATD